MEDKYRKRNVNSIKVLNSEYINQEIIDYAAGERYIHRNIQYLKVFISKNNMLGGNLTSWTLFSAGYSTAPSCA